MVQQYLFLCAILMVYECMELFSWLHFCKAYYAYSIIFSNFVIICRICKRQCKDSLLFQIGLMNPCKAPSYHRCTTSVSWRHGSVFSAASFSIVVISYYNPLEPLLLVLSCNRWKCIGRASKKVLSFSNFVVVCIYCAQEDVVANFV